MFTEAYRPPQLRLLVLQKDGPHICESCVFSDVVLAYGLVDAKDTEGDHYYQKRRSDGFVFDLKYRHDFLYVQINRTDVMTLIGMQMFLTTPCVVQMGILRFVDGFPGKRNFLEFVEEE